MKKTVSILMLICMAFAVIGAVAEDYSWDDGESGGWIDYDTGVMTTWNKDSDGNLYYQDTSGTSGVYNTDGSYINFYDDGNGGYYYDSDTGSGYIPGTVTYSTSSSSSTRSSSSSSGSSTYVAPSTAAVTAVSPYNANVKTNGGQLNVRVKPNKGATILTKLSNGYPLTVIGYTGEWLQVQANGYTGYVPSRYVSAATSSVATTTASTSALPYYAIVNPTNNFVNMRAQPDKSSAVINVYYYGYQLKVVAESNGWCQVVDEATGMTGYMMKALLLYSGPAASTDAGEQG